MRTHVLDRTYRKWDSMMGRCYRRSHPAWSYYGGRGVAVCERWRLSYTAFWEDMGEAPPGMWLDRIDGEKGYEPGNCRWVTPSESARNRKQRGPIPGSLRQRCLSAGVDYQLVIQRKRRGWKEADALRVPRQKRGRMTAWATEEAGLA